MTLTTIVKRYPTFSVEFITEKSSHIIEYDTGKQLTGDDFEEAIISFSVKNAMEDDTPVFSLVMLAKEKWDMVVGANDLVRIKVIPDVRRGEPNSPYVMVGMVSDIHREGEYADGILLYRITGMSMAKVMMNFEIGVIQGISIPIADFGWLPDIEDSEIGLNFSGNTAAGIGDEIMDRFIYKYTNYNFAGNRTLEDFFEHEFYSWSEDEALADVTPFVNYEGNIRQFIEDVAAKPFNEVYFDFTPEGKCKAYMRPTPFDADRWKALRPYKFTSDIVVEESFGKSDADMFSVYVVHPPFTLDFTSLELGARPKFHPDLIGKYGYTILEVENRYLLSDVFMDAEEPVVDEEGNVIAPAPTYDELFTFIVENELNDAERIRTDRSTVKSAIIEAFPGVDDALADGVIDSIVDGTFTQDEYVRMRDSTGDEELDQQINAERTAAGEKIEKFTQKIYNWYCENANFYSGDIRVLGDPMFRVGTRILYEDFERDTVWEFYVESVQHEFSFTNGYTTILGVTRGLPEGGKDRFSNLWGKSEDFEGGYLGEFTNAQYLELGKMVRPSGADGPGSSWSLAGGGNVAMAALNTARRVAGMDSVYVFGGGRTGSNPFNSSPVRVDCSSFVWWCYYEHGISLKGGKTGMTTDTIKVDPQLMTISERGSSKADAIGKLQQGDIVYFDTYKTDGHVGIYSGGGTFIGAQSSTGVASAKMDSGYWYDKFNGRVLRYRE